MQHPPLLATLLLATLLTACGGGAAKSSDSLDSTAQTTVDAPPDEGGNLGKFEEADGPSKEARASNYKSFMLEGYETLGAESGDLNKDKYPDMVLALRMVDEAEASEQSDFEIKRPLLLLLGQPDGSFELAARNDDVVLCHDCGGVFGDPYDGITIKDGYFSIEHYGGSNWRWTRIITFKWSESDKDWLLHKDGGVSYHTSDPDKMEEEVKTVKDFGKVPFGKFTYEGEE
jgi:hypothetical protein